MKWRRSSRFGFPCSGRALCRRPVDRGALAKRVLQVDGDAVLPAQFDNRLDGQCRKGRHPVGRKLSEIEESIVIKVDQSSHWGPICWRRVPLGAGSRGTETGDDEAFVDL